MKRLLAAALVFGLLLPIVALVVAVADAQQAPDPRVTDLVRPAPVRFSTKDVNPGRRKTSSVER
jgi:hypothetical protein